VKKLWELPESIQEQIVPILLEHHGQIIRKFSSPYSWIYTLKSQNASNYLIAKAPKLRADMTAEEALARLLKMLTEINAIHRVCMHSFVHRFGGIELVLGVPFLISVKRDMNLRDVMEEGPMNPVNALATAIQIARGIEYVQSKGVVCHQDMKAENIFVDVIANKFSLEGVFPYAFQAYLADFDLVDRAVLFGQPNGSRPYQAPEQYKKDGSPSYDKVDVFALAVNLVEMLTGGMHPLGMRTTDAWPKSIIGNKWNREDPWKAWARDPVISPDVKLKLGSSLLLLITEMLSADYDTRPSMSVVKSRLLKCLEEADRPAWEALCLNLQQADEAANVNAEAGWLYMDDLVSKINQAYAAEL
jgi:serine/threonine protein kinase